MAVLANSKHEKYAQGLARGVAQGRAYTDAGFRPNKGGASNLAHTPLISDRVEELKNEIASNITEIMTNPANEEAYENLAEMGLTMEWVGAAFKKIYDKAIDTNQLGPANTAVANIQKMVEIEQRSGDAKSPDENTLVDIRHVTDLISAMKEVVKTSEVDHNDDQFELVDVTPPEADQTSEFPLLSGSKDTTH